MRYIDTFNLKDFEMAYYVSIRQANWGKAQQALRNVLALENRWRQITPDDYSAQYVRTRWTRELAIKRCAEVFESPKLRIE